MKNTKRALVLFLALALGLLLFLPALAREGTGFSDVGADAWYAEAVDFCVQRGLMSGTDAGAFEPDAAMSRAMLAAVLHRAHGAPAPGGPADFADVAAESWCGDAVAWASQAGVMGGYGNGLFGADDPVTREQLAAILWRDAGSPPPTGDAAGFADQSAISPYALDAVAWARESGLLNGKEGNRFDPLGTASRAEVAAVLMNRLSGGPAAPVQPGETPAPTPQPTPGGEGKVLVAYFSATGNTGGIAEQLADILAADRYEIVPQVPYTSADLNYSDPGSRSQVEQRDSNARPAMEGGVEHMEDYGLVFLGYPIWNGKAPRILSTFLDAYDLSGKTIVPFCTSGSSGIGSSATDLHALAPDAVWLSGVRFSGGASRSDVERWVEGLDLPEPSSNPVRLSLAFGGHEVFVTMEDDPTTRDFLTMLPATLTFQDFAGSEKISYLPRPLSTEGAPSSCDPAEGDLTLYVPWGNLAIFYRDSSGPSSSLIPMGHIDSGLELLAAQSGDFEVSVSIADQT